jgi:hypothetical protein
MDNLAQIINAARNELIERGAIAPDMPEDEYTIEYIENVAEVTMYGWIVLLWRLNAEYEVFYAVEQERAALTSY